MKRASNLIIEYGGLNQALVALVESHNAYSKLADLAISAPIKVEHIFARELDFLRQYTAHMLSLSARIREYKRRVHMAKLSAENYRAQAHLGVCEMYLIDVRSYEKELDAARQKMKELCELRLTCKKSAHAKLDWLFA